MGGNGPRFQSVWTEACNRRIYSRALHGLPKQTGAPVVLVPGLALSSHAMLPTAEAIAPSHPVYAIDLPGYGISEKPPKVLSVTDQAACIAAWMKALGLDQAVLIANSVGCQAAAELAAANPNLVSRLVFTGPTTDPSSRPPWRATARWLRELPMEASMFPIMLRDYWDCGPRRFFGYLAHTGRHEIQDVLPRLSMPVLVLRGERDPIVTQPWAEQVARLAPHGRLIVVPKAAHNLTFLAPAAVAALVEEWAGQPAEAAREKRAA